MCKVLIFSRDASFPGGVVNFIELLKRVLASKIEAFHFKIGKRKGYWGKLAHWFIPFIDAIKLFFVVIRNKFDAYHLNPSLDMKSVFRDGLFLIILRLVRAKNIIVAFHGWDISTERRIRNSFWIGFYFRFAFRGADKYLLLDVSFKKMLIDQGIPEHRILLYTTMFDGENFTGVERTVDSNEVRVLFLSRLVKEKGIYELLEAMLILRRKYENVRLIIAGSGPEEEEIRQWIMTHNMGNEVRMVGYVKGKDKAVALRNADIFILPSYSEGCPVSLLEAMGAGLPAIITPVGGIPRIIIDGINGFLLDNISPESIATALAKLITNKALRVTIGEHNRQEAWKKYDAPKVASLFLSLYRGDQRK